MRQSDPLERAYTRLLRCYPRWYRRERGAEILTTLIDAAAAGQRRPSRADVVDLLIGALRCRLRRVPAMVVGLAVALLVGAVGSAAATRLSGYPGPPAESAAVAVARTAVGLDPRDVPGPVVHCDLWCSQDSVDGDDVVSYDSPPDRTDLVDVAYDVPRERTDEVVAAAHERLAAAGWRVEPVAVFGNQRWFEASHAGLRATVRGAADPELDAVSVAVSKAGSPLAAVLAVLGFLAGAVLGGLVHRRAVRRYRRHRMPVRAPAAIAAGFVVMVMMPVAMLTARYGYVMTTQGDWKPKDVQAAEFIIVSFAPLWLAVAVAALSALAMVATRLPGPLEVNSAQ